MKCCQFKHIFLVTVYILLIGLIGVTGCTNAESDIVLAEFEEPRLQPPMEVTASQLYEDYMTDPIAADDKYKWERLCFYEVEVEEVFDSGARVKQFFITDGVQFVLRSGSQMQNVEPGYVLNLVGECRGLRGIPREVVIIKDCWAEGVNCDLGEDEPFDQY